MRNDRYCTSVIARLLLGVLTSISTISCAETETTVQAPASSIGSTLTRSPQQKGEYPPAKIECPDTPSWTHRSGSIDWYLCNLDVDSQPAYTPYGIDYPFSYMAPADIGKPGSKPARLHVMLHPSDRGRGIYVTDRSSFQFSRRHVELHNVEQKYQGNTGGWWVYSGQSVGRPENYNGRQIAASLDYLLNRYGDGIDLAQGIYLSGKSLGGAGIFHQAMILPRYQQHIAIVDATIGRMMMPKNHRKEMKRLWGEALLDTVDIRKHWHKVTDIHFNWRGGSNDDLGTFDLEFLKICERRKISCSAVWLRSGHGVREKGYARKSKLWLDKNQNVTLDKILPVITNNSSNHWGEVRGYHNRGISWHHRHIVESKTRISIPLQYTALKALGPELPDQPDTVTFSLTPRHIQQFSARVGDAVAWRFGQQRGKTTVNAEGLITIDNLQLVSGAGYQNLVITQVAN